MLSCVAPETRSDWRALLLDVSVDHGGSHETMVSVIDAYREWKARHGICAYAGCQRVLNREAGDRRTRFCHRHCAARALAEARRKPRKLTE